MRGAVRRAGSPWPLTGTTRVGRSVCTAAHGVLPGWRGTGPCKLPLGGAIVDVEGGFGGGRRERDALILRSRGVRSLSSRTLGCLTPGCCARLSPRICPAPRRAVRPRRVSPPLGSLPPPLPAAAARFCCLPYPDSSLMFFLDPSGIAGLLPVVKTESLAAGRGQLHNPQLLGHFYRQEISASTSIPGGRREPGQPGSPV